MKPERFKRTKSVVASSAIALVVAALVMGLSSSVIGSRGASSEHLGFDLTSGSGFSITSTVYTTPSGAYPAASCSGTPALLYPGVTRCVVFSVHNNLKATITVTGITSSLDPGYTVPAACSGTNLSLPTFSGSFNVASGATVASPGVPILLKDTHSNQTACANSFVFHFDYSGTATYTEVYGTSTAVTSSQNPSTVGNSVTYTATVTASATASQDPVPSSPTGSVTFYDGTVIPAHVIAGCSGVAVTSATTTTAKATCPSPIYGTPGNHSITAVYANTDGNFTGSTSPVFTQMVNASLAGTTTALTSTPNPSLLGQSVTMSATVTKASGSGTPTGTVSFRLGSPTGTVVGTGTLNSSAKASATTSSLPAGTDDLYAVYPGDTHFSGSTSPVQVQTVVAPPTKCTGSYPNFFYGTPLSPLINGTNGNDFVYAFGANYLINGFNGNDCIEAGDGNNFITDGNGTDVVATGNGNNLITLGNGTDSVTAGNGTNQILAGNGTDTVSVGNGSHNQLLVGNGSDTISLGTGTSNTVTLGSGTDTVTVTSPATALNPIHDTINGGPGNETIYLGSGSDNTYNGVRGKTNTCHLSKPPASWHGTVAAYYNDTITNCTVVTP